MNVKINFVYRSEQTEFAMLKSYEAVYQNGHLHWLGMPPPREIEKRHVLVVVDLDKQTDKPATDIHQLLAKTRGCIKPLATVDEIDHDIAQMRSEWDREWER
jgi:hypothetical protein